MNNMTTDRLYTWTYKDRSRPLYWATGIMGLYFTLTGFWDSFARKHTGFAISFLIMIILIIILYSFLLIKTKKPTTASLVFGKDTIEYWLNSKETVKIDHTNFTAFEKITSFTRLNNLKHYSTSEISEILLSRSKGQIIIRLLNGKKGLISLAELKDPSTLELIVKEVNEFSTALSFNRSSNL